jgi:hypothetical protein
MSMSMSMSVTVSISGWSRLALLLHPLADGDARHFDRMLQVDFEQLVSVVVLVVPEIRGGLFSG